MFWNFQHLQLRKRVLFQHSALPGGQSNFQITSEHFLQPRNEEGFCEVVRLRVFVGLLPKHAACVAVSAGASLLRSDIEVAFADLRRGADRVETVRCHKRNHLWTGQFVKVGNRSRRVPVRPDHQNPDWNIRWWRNNLRRRNQRTHQINFRHLRGRSWNQNPRIRQNGNRWNFWSLGN